MKKEKEKAKNAKNAKNAGTGSLRPPQSGAQQPGGAAQVQPSSELHPAVATSSTTPVVAATQPAVSPSTNSLPNAMIPHAGRWIRFWLFFCCASAQYTDSHH
ncbi:hypothetical protein K503DRAFT_206986 [Rhizopogon vinicolor AM-OR11-026]|uniref:Uncharacterized protein n=1 Tax=Rhizopogon vinicolor AM-OR11-026 TaxID=1314800 RepID=A0A1B7MZ46_9AGAM|nr:hypothetical protein K503DRAFT_206986 [Rhizopogon vinicolor AM-OR11-026]